MTDTHEHAVSSHWDGPFDESRFEIWAKHLRNRLLAKEVDLGFVFATSGYREQFAEILEILRINCEVPHLIGCTGHSLISQSFEYEQSEGIVAALHALPGAVVQSFGLPGDEAALADVFASNGGDSLFRDGAPNGFIVFGDPFSMNPENLLSEFNHRYPGVPVLGGLACGTRKERQTTLFHNGRVVESGSVGVAIGGEVGMESLISQGCQPVGDPYTVTSVDRNVLDGIGNRNAYEVLNNVFSELPDALKLKSRGNLHVGFVINEYQEDFGRGDFLVRNLIGADPKRGALLVGALPRVGQTLQFQLRDRHAAMDDLNQRLETLRKTVEGREIYGALLSTCTGRGKRFFKVPDFDANSIREALGPFGMAGFFGNGEFGPVGGVNFVHGYTAALALFVKKQVVA